MKRKLLSLAVVLLCSVATWAQDAGTYYIQNVSTGKWLGPGNSWGTQASALSHADYWKLAKISDGVYTLESVVSNGGTNYYLNGTYCDGSATNFTFSAVAGKANTYTIANGSGGLLTASGNIVNVSGSDASAEVSQWKLWSAADMSAGMAAATSDNPFDATYLIKDHDLGRNNRDYSSWTNTNATVPKTTNNSTHGNNKGEASDGDAIYSIEAYKKTFEVKQTLSSVPNGRYALRVNGFYRQDGSDTNLPFLFAGSTNVTLPERTGSENDMQAAAESFVSGNYLSDPATTLVTNNTLMIGVKTTGNSCWAIFKNFHLEYYGNAISYYSPADFTNDSQAAAGAWKSYDVNAGWYKIASNASITFYYSQDNSEDADATKSVAISEGGYTYLNLSEGKLYFKSSANATLTLTEGFVANDDITAFFLTNPNFTGNADGWEGGPSYQSNNVEKFNTTFDVYQTATDLPAGYYWIKAKAFDRETDQTATYESASSVSKAYLYAGNASTLVKRIYDDASSTQKNSGTNELSFTKNSTTVYIPNMPGAGEKYFDAGLYDNELLMYHSGGDLRIGIKKYVKTSNDWCLFDNFRLIYAGSTPSNGADMTSLITNPSFEAGDLTAWTNTNTTFSTNSDSQLGNKVGTYYAYAASNRTQGINQDLSGMPNGYYVLHANAYAYDITRSGSDLTHPGALLMGGQETPIRNGATDTYSVAYQVTEAGNVNFGIAGTGKKVDNVITSRFYVDNFTLTYYTELPAVDITSLTSEAMAPDVRATLTSASSTYNSSKTAANYNALQTAIVNAKASIAAFAANTGTDADWTGIIQNPSFENWDGSNPIGWTQVAVGNGDIKKEGGIGEDSGSYRFYIWSATAGAGYVKQTIKNLPAGNYKLSAYMFSEAGDALTLTAGSISGSVLASDGSANLIEVYFTQASDGDVEISAKHSNTWFNIDNFHLTLNPTLPAEISGVSGKMKASVSTAQTNAINDYNAVDGQTFANMLTAQAAKEEAIKSIKIYNSIATIRSNYETKAGALDAAGQDAYDTAINTASTGAETKYEAGDYETAAQAEEAYHSDYVTAVKAQTTEGKDMTEAIVNPSFESDLSTGWSTGDMGRQSNTAFDKKSGTYYVERYHVAGEKYIKQTLTGFHSGVYTLTAAAYATNSTSPKLYVKVGETESSTAVSSSKDYSVSFNYDGTSTLEIGFSATLTSTGWVCVDNFRLTYDDDALPTSLDEVTGYMNADVKTAANTAIAAYNSDKTIANYSAAQAAITDAEASRAVYVTINGLMTTYQGKADALDPAGQAAYTAAVNAENPDGAATKYENGTYTTASEAETAYSRDYITAVKAQTTAGANMTGAIINNSFETGTTDGWTYTASNDHGAKENSNNTYKMSGVDGSYLFNIWSTGNAISQTLTGMPAGTYRLTAVMGTDAGATLNVKLGDATGSAASVDKGTGVVVSVEKTLATAGDLTVGADAGGSQWYKVDNFQLTYLGISKNLTVAAKAGKYGTIIFPFTPDVSTGYDNITFYSCNSVSGEVLQLSEEYSPAANTPYIIKNDGDDFSLNVNGYGDRGLNDSYTSGYLTGVYTASTVTAGNYVLQTQDGVQGFYKVNGDGLTAVPYRAYLTVPSGVKAFFFDVTDGINNLNVDDDLNTNEVIYNLAGQRVQKAVKGLYIKNGKKVVIK